MSNKDFLIVGLGASAGGIAACREFFTHVPSDTGIAYVVILHLSPAHESQLAEVLQTSAAIPVIQVRERTIVEPDHVYVIPPNQTLSIRDGHLELLAMTGSEQRRSPVDTFFRTLAEAHGPRAGCVVLSGTGANGSLGLKHVKAQGGICLVQDPDQAAYADMPQHAIATGAADAVLPVADIPGKLLAYNKTLDLVGAPPPRRPPHRTRTNARYARSSRCCDRARAMIFQATSVRRYCDESAGAWPSMSCRICSPTRPFFAIDRRNPRRCSRIC